MSEPISTTALSTHGALALFGAVVHASKAHREGESKTGSDFIILTVMSSFSGVMFSLVGFYFFGESQPYITMALAGTGGYLGVEGMAIIVDTIRVLINKRIK